MKKLQEIFVLFVIFGLASSANVTLLIAYCTSPSSGSGAIVEVNPKNGDWSIIGTFPFPAAEKCPLGDYNGIDIDYSTGNLFLSWNNKSQILIINAYNASIIDSISVKNTFTGFVNFEYFPIDKTLRGLSWTSTTSGFCYFGCFQYGSFHLETEEYISSINLNWAEAYFDIHFYDESSDTFWVQLGSNLVPPSLWCGPTSYSLCLIALAASSGEVKSATFSNYTIFQYGRKMDSSGNILIWMQSAEFCPNTNDSLLFGKLNLATAAVTPIVCISKETVVYLTTFLASFSFDETILVTGSGNSENPEPQLIVLETETANIILDSNLKGLAEALHAYNNVIDIWYIDFLPSQ